MKRQKNTCPLPPDNGGGTMRLPRPVQAVLILAWAAVILFCIFNRDRFSADEVLKYTPRSPWLAALLMLLLFALKSLSIVVYCGILYAADGLLFPLPAAILMNILGTAVMVSVPYFIGRRHGGDLSARITKKYPKTVLIKEFRDENDFVFTLAVRLIGLLPCDIVSLYFGACRVSYPHYLAACILGMLPPAITMPIIGTSAHDPTSPRFLISVCVNALLGAGSLIACALIGKRRKNAADGKKGCNDATRPD